MKLSSILPALSNTSHYQASPLSTNHTTRLNQSSIDQLEDYFDSRSVQRGRALFHSGAVASISFDPRMNEVHARVQGTQATPYEVLLTLDDYNELTDAWCSCPVTFNCKHAVAALIMHRSGLAQAHRKQKPDQLKLGRKPALSESPRSSTDTTRQWCELWQDTQTAPAQDDTSSELQRWQRSRIYSLSVQKPGEHWSSGVMVTLLDAPFTAAGYFGKGRRANRETSYTSYPLELTSIDKDIQALGSARLQADQGRYTRDTACYELTGHFGNLMFELIIKTGRCFLDTDRHQPLIFGPTRTLSIHWQPLSDGSHRLVPELDGLTHCWIVNAEQPYWIDPGSFTAGAIVTELNSKQLTLLLDAPAIPDSQLPEFTHWQETARVGRANYSQAKAPASNHNSGHIHGHENNKLAHEALQQNPINAAQLLPPPPIKLPPLIDVYPSPVLLLHSPDGIAHVDHWELALLIRYDTILLPCELNQGSIMTSAVNDQGENVRIRRQFDLEHAFFVEAMQQLSGMLPHWQDDTKELLPIFSATGDTPAARFSAYVKLVRMSAKSDSDVWQLEVLPPVHVEPERPGNFDGLVERAKDGTPGWFDLSLGVELDGERYDLMPLVAEYIERGRGDEPLFVETTDARFMQVDATLLRPVAEVLDELGTPAINDSKVRLSRTRALALQDLDDALSDDGLATAWRGSSDPFVFAKRLHELSHVDTKAFNQTTLPRGLKATLRPYQRAGLGWLNALAKSNLCGILADDMGLGKTLQTLAHILWLRQSRRLKGPVLIVVPTSLLLNWAREAAHFTPRLKVRVWHGQERHEQPLDAIDPAPHLVITSYGLALRDNEILANHGFDMLVLDEAQQIRNPLAKTTRAIKSLPIERRLCLSGTPLENHLGELWSQFDFLMPDLLGDAQRFNSHYRTPIEKYGDTGRQQRLAAAVKPFLLRRRKEEVATDLPPKTEMLREVHLGTAQAKLYESIRASMQKRVRKALQSKGLAQSHVTVLDALLKLRQCCCHPELVKIDSAKRVKDSAKTTLILDMIDELIAEGRRILVFSSFTSMLDILERELEAREHRWVKLTGRTRKRDAVIDAFQRGDVPLFLISLKAGGTGLNLTAADTVIHYDPWWNPAAEAQASARAHRIGQNKPVFVYKLVAADTVEQRIVSMQQRKQDLADAMIENGDGASLSSLSVDETLALFDPD